VVRGLVPTQTRRPRRNHWKLLKATKSHGKPAGLWFCGVCGVCGVSFGPVTGLKTSLFDKKIYSFLDSATG
jgi:hypothetical protein